MKNFMKRILALVLIVSHFSAYSAQTYQTYYDGDRSQGMLGYKILGFDYTKHKAGDFFYFEADGKYYGAVYYDTTFSKDGLPIHRIDWEEIPNPKFGDASDDKRVPSLNEGSEASENVGQSPNLNFGQRLGVLGVFGAQNIQGMATSAAQNGAIAGASVLIYKGLVYDAAFRRDMSEMQARMASVGNDIARYEAIHNESITEGFTQINQALFSFENVRAQVHPGANPFDFSSLGHDNYQFKSTDSAFVNGLKLIREALSSVRGYNSSTVNAKALGFAMTEAADLAHSQQRMADAYAAQQYALAITDLLFGLDPVTGTFRSVYEAFTGKNFVTGQELSALERSFAVVGAVSFGYGEKIALGLNGIQKVGSKFFANSKARQALTGAFKMATRYMKSPLYRAEKLWETQKYLAKNHLGLLEKIEQKTNADQYLKYVKDRLNVEFLDPHTLEPIKQEMTIEALETIERVEKKGLVVRRGSSGLEADEVARLVAEGHNPKNLEKVVPSKINAVAENVAESSVFHGELSEDILTQDYANRYGIYSSRPDFIEISNVKPGSKFITRAAPKGSTYNIATKEISESTGGGIEILIEKAETSFNRYIPLDPEGADNAFVIESLKELGYFK